MSFIKYAKLKIIHSARSVGDLGVEKIFPNLCTRIASIKPIVLSPERFLYVRNRAISAEESHGPNDNDDAFPRDELQRGHSTFINCPNTVDHINRGPSDEVGMVVDSICIPPKFEGEKIVEGDYVENIWALDKGVAERRVPGIIQGILNREITDSSMGCDVQRSICSICGNEATIPEEYCEHIRFHKGGVFAAGEGGEEKRAYERNFGIVFFEDTIVLPSAWNGRPGSVGADPDAKLLEVLANRKPVVLSSYIVHRKKAQTPGWGGGFQSPLPEIGKKPPVVEKAEKEQKVEDVEEAKRKLPSVEEKEEAGDELERLKKRIKEIEEGGGKEESQLSPRKEGMTEDEASASAMKFMVEQMLEGDTFEEAQRKAYDTFGKEITSKLKEKGVIMLGDKQAAKFPGGFEGCVKHFVADKDFSPKDPGDTKTEAARKLCAYIKKKKYGGKIAVPWEFGEGELEKLRQDFSSEKKAAEEVNVKDTPFPEKEVEKKRVDESDIDKVNLPKERVEGGSDGSAGDEKAVPTAGEAGVATGKKRAGLIGDAGREIKREAKGEYKVSLKPEEIKKILEKCNELDGALTDSMSDELDTFVEKNYPEAYKAAVEKRGRLSSRGKKKAFKLRADVIKEIVEEGIETFVKLEEEGERKDKTGEELAEAAADAVNKAVEVEVPAGAVVESLPEGEKEAAKKQGFLLKAEVVEDLVEEGIAAFEKEREEDPDVTPAEVAETVAEGAEVIISEDVVELAKEELGTEGGGEEGKEAVKKEKKAEKEEDKTKKKEKEEEKKEKAKAKRKIGQDTIEEIPLPTKVPVSPGANQEDTTPEKVETTKNMDKEVEKALEEGKTPVLKGEEVSKIETDKGETVQIGARRRLEILRARNKRKQNLINAVKSKLSLEKRVAQLDKENKLLKIRLRASQVKNLVALELEKGILAPDKVDQEMKDLATLYDTDYPQFAAQVSVTKKMPEKEGSSGGGSHSLIERKLARLKKAWVSRKEGEVVSRGKEEKVDTDSLEGGCFFDETL